MSIVQQSSGDVSKAVGSLKKAVSLSGKDITPYIMLGSVHVRARDFKSALQVYRDAEKVSPNNPQVIFQAASILELTGKKAQAATEYQRILRIAPNHVPALNNLAYYYADQGGNTQAAIQLAARAYVLAPKDPSILDTLGYILTKSGKYDQAITALKRSSDLLPDNPSVLYHLALAQKGKGLDREAALTIEKALAKGEFPEAQSARQILKKIKEPVRR